MDARILLATLYVSNEQHGAAEMCIQEALSAGLDDPVLHYLLGNIYALQGRNSNPIVGPQSSRLSILSSLMSRSA